MKQVLFHFSILLFITVAVMVPSCSSDEEEILVGNESPTDFFAKTFPQEQEGEGTDVTEVHFSGFDKKGNACVVVNSYDELKAIYQGKEPLPKVDFSKYSLIIGRAWANVGLKFKDLTVSEDDKGNSVVTLHFTVLFDAVYAKVTYYYYWALCPKFSPKNLTTNLEFET